MLCSVVNYFVDIFFFLRFFSSIFLIFLSRFRGEDGSGGVIGSETVDLPIYGRLGATTGGSERRRRHARNPSSTIQPPYSSEARRVGTECRSQSSACTYKKN